MSNDEPLAATKDRLGEYDAIASARPGEPLFPIQGGDPFGPATVLHWVDLCRRAAMSENNPKRAEAMLRKATDAELIAWQMADYQKGEQDAQTPAEATARPRPTYTGYVDDADEETLQARRQRAGRIQTAGRLHNVVAQATEAAEQLAQLRVCPAEEVLIREAIEKLVDAARTIEPRRGQERS